MNLNPGKTEFTDAEHEGLRREIDRVKKLYDLTEAQIARGADVSPSTLNSYLKGKYQGQTDPVAVALFRWLEAERKSAEERLRMPVKPAFVALATSTAVTNRIHYARAMGRIVVISGVPGVSKTATAMQYCSDTPRAWLSTMDPATSGVPTMLLELLADMGINDVRGTPQQLSRRVVTKVMEAESVIIVDESQHLSDKAIEQLRSINDKTRQMGRGVGIVLMGNEAAYSKIGPTGTKAAFAQVSSRIAQRRYIQAPLREDAAALAQAWAEANREILGPREIEFLVSIAMTPGGLRNVEMTMEGALTAAFGTQQPLSLAHLKGAFGQVTDLTHRAA